MSAEHLVVGVDGADWHLIRSLGAKLPAFQRLMSEGIHGPLESVLPFATLPNWTTFLTGVNPGQHGVFDFTTRRGYRVAFTGGTVRDAPSVFSRLDALGKRCAVIGFPATWPPEELQHGVFISGWDSPVAFEADASFVWPRSLHGEITRRFGPMRFDDVDQFAQTDTRAWHSALADRLISKIERKTEMALWLLQSRAWDVFALYFGETDTAAHHLWSLHDPASPRYNAETSLRDQQGLFRVYAAVDEALLRLRHASGSSVELTVVSDHGSGGASTKVLSLNRYLADCGLLRFRDTHTRSRAADLKDQVLQHLPPHLKERAFTTLGGALPGWLESQTRFGSIDMSKTLAFSDELNYFPAIHLNVRGREPMGTIDPSNIGPARKEITDTLLRLRDPWTGAPVIGAVHPREAIYSGPHLERAPDLVLELNLDNGYSYNLKQQTDQTWSQLQPEAFLGRKGQSLPGSHRPFGFFAAHGPSVSEPGRIRAKIADATATMLARMGVASNGEGRCLIDSLATSDVLPDAQPLQPQRRNSSTLEQRLRILGYVD